MKTFQEIIETIETEIGTLYQGGAIKWIDDNFEEAWSKAMLRFEEALISQDWTRVELEAKNYKAAILNFLDLYKKHKAQSAQPSFFENLKQRRNAS